MMHRVTNKFNWEGVGVEEERDDVKEVRIRWLQRKKQRDEVHDLSWRLQTQHCMQSCKCALLTTSEDCLLYSKATANSNAACTLTLMSMLTHVC